VVEMEDLARGAAAVGERELEMEMEMEVQWAVGMGEVKMEVVGTMGSAEVEIACSGSCPPYVPVQATAQESASVPLSSTMKC
jgi:hypothetical protein